MDDLPVHPGTYALIFELIESCRLNVGHLGWNNFPPGFYVYCGSAYGPGGLRARLGRHLRGVGRIHWHIDHLRPVAKVRGYIYQVQHGYDKLCIRLECDWCKQLAALPGASIPIPKFGASDCRSGCPAHLVHFPGYDFVDEMCTLLDYPGTVQEFKHRP